MKIKIDKVRYGYKCTWFDIKHKNLQGIDTYTCLIQDDSGEKMYYSFLPYGSYDFHERIKNII